MPRGGRGSGRRGGHKGKSRHFTSAEELDAQRKREEKEKQWRQQKGINSDDEEEAEESSTGAVAKQPIAEGEGESESEESEEENPKKGVSHLIEIENPNRQVKKTKKVTELNLSDGPQLSRREREAVEKQEAKARYEKLHVQGKTDEARADLARLAIIRKQREDAAKKRDEEKAKRDAAAKKS